MIVNRTQLAELIGCSPTTILAMVKRGAPYISRPKSQGGAWKFESAEVIKWMADLTGSSDELEREAKVARTRQLVARASLRELELAEKTGEMVRIPDLIAKIEEGEAITKSRIMALPGRLGQAVSIETDPAKVEEILRAEIDEALEELNKPWNERL